jgi:ATP-binding cassette subfamily B protein
VSVTGRRTSARWRRSGITDGVATGDRNRPAPSKFAFWHLLSPFVEGQRRRLVAVAITAVCGGFAEAIVFVIIARVALAVAADHSHITLSAGPIDDWSVSVNALIALAAVLVVLRIALQLLQSRLSARAGVDVMNRTRKRFVRSYLAARWDLQSTQREGRLQELLTTYTSAAYSAIGWFAQGIAAGLNLFAFLLTALVVNVFAAIGIALTALLVGMSLRPLRAAVRRRTARAAAANLEFATGVTELGATLQEVRVFGVEVPVGDRLAVLADRESALSFRRWFLSSSISGLYQGMGLLLVVGALAIVTAVGFSDLGSIGAVVLIMVRSMSYGQGVQSAIQGIQETSPYLETLTDEQDRFRLAAIPRDGKPFEHIGALSFAEVTFEYKQGHPVLRKVSFDAHQGEIIGIVGPSGAGKSTLVQLLLRLREPTSGRVLADGEDVQTLSIDRWYELVAFVSQDARLFAGTVADNIRFFRSDATQEDLERAARLAHLHDDIVSWPNGYDTWVGERGGQLSGGQQQRLCIARALVEHPDIVVLDEPTSALDVKSESLMRDTMQQLAPECTVFIVAHRLSTLSICDRIMVILGGEMQGFDDPATLEASNPFYREALRLSGMR